jgi:hypothetical protein
MVGGYTPILHQTISSTAERVWHRTSLLSSAPPGFLVGQLDTQFQDLDARSTLGGYNACPQVSLIVRLRTRVMNCADPLLASLR